MDKLDRVAAAATRSERREASLTDEHAAVRQEEDPADVALASQGDQQAFERLYRLNVARIRGLVRRMAGLDAADELTQDVFIHAWEKLGSFRGESRFGTWLYRLAINVILERGRTSTRRAFWLQDDQQALGQAPALAADGVFAIDFETAVDRLPAGARQVFLLHDVEGYKHHEIGHLLGIAPGTSKGQLHRARMILRRHLGGSRQRLPGGAQK